MLNSSEGVRWSLVSIELQQPALRLIAPDEEDITTTPNITNATSKPDEPPRETGIKSPSTAIRETNTDAKLTESRFAIHPGAINRPIILEWWEEIFSVSIAVICTALSVAVLLYTDGRSLSEWKLRLQPNTLIALLSTITRAALIFPLAECFGNLKWEYFERPRPLAHLQIFDAASRGPLGAFKYLWNLPTHSPLSSFAALTTTLLLLLQPFAQQTMSFASRAAPMSNETAHIFRAMSWNTSSVNSLSDFAEPPIMYGSYKAISREDVDGSNRGQCSTSLCEFDDFDTLAVCSDCEQRTLSGSIYGLYEQCLWRNISGPHNSLQSEYIVFGMETYDPVHNKVNQNVTKIIFQEIEKRREHETFELSVDCGQLLVSPFEPTIHLEITSNYSMDSIGLQISAFSRSNTRPVVQLWTQEDDQHVRGEERFIGAEDPISDPLAKDAVFNACGHQYAATRSHGPNTILNATCLSLNTDLNLWFSKHALSDQFGILNGTETKCSLTPCVQRVTGARLKNNRYMTQNISSNAKWYHSNKTELEEYGGSLGPTSGRLCSGDDNGCLYSWTPDTLSFLGSWINSTIDTASFYRMYRSQKNSPGSDYTLFYKRVAAQMSEMLQSPANPDIANFTGVAHGSETYVHVRWLWFILPLVLLELSLLIIVLSIWDSSRKGYLFKNSFLAAIMFELQGWEPHEYGVDGTWTRQSMRHVEKKAERMVVRMQLPQDDDGGLRLKKE